jgi:hypothetical protein
LRWQGLEVGLALKMALDAYAYKAQVWAARMRICEASSTEIPKIKKACVVQAQAWEDEK